MRSIILGTDWWTDCDDAVALRLLARYVKEGKINLLGIAINACMEYSVASLVGFLRAEGVTGIPVGLDAAATDFGGKPPYQKRLAERFCPNGQNTDAMDAVRLYRRLLSKAEAPVELIEIGYPQVLAGLLASGPDDLSPKSGWELVKEKVSKLWAMAGKWDGDGERENNFCRNERSRRAGKVLCESFPAPITFLGWEVGNTVITGGGLPADDHLHLALADHGSANGRSSWDPMLVLMALIGDEEAAGYDTVTGYASVDAETGANHFTPDEGGPHKFVRKKHPDRYYEDAINGFMPNFS